LYDFIPLIPIAPIKIIEAKANGLAFDPFGKFLASQSSEGKDLTIWRVQDFKFITQEKKHEDFYRQSQTNSLFRRLSWSSDGNFISSIAGRIGN
jgi:WD40 repeat protein